MKLNLSINKKYVLVTGCSSGIGYHCAKRLRDDGKFEPILTARKDSDVKSLAREGFLTVKMDMRDSNSVQNGFKEVLRLSNGNLFAVFNNAGFGQPGAVEDLSRKAIRDQFETNVFGVIELGNLALKVFRKQKYGKIIQNSSILGFVAFKYRGAYNASKFAIEAFSDTLRVELKNTNISVSLIEPGPIKSNFRKNAYKEFLKYIKIEKSFHHNAYKKAIERFESDENDPFTLDCEAVYKVLRKILEIKNPKDRYRVTVPTKLFWYLKKFLPIKILDYIISKV